MFAFRARQTISEAKRVFATVIAANDSDAAYGTDRAVVFGRLEDVGGGARQFNELARAHVICCSSLVFQNHTLVCSTAPDADIVLFDVSAGTLNRRGVLQGHTEGVYGVAAHGHWLASGSVDRTVRIWSMTTHEQLHCMADHSDAVESVGFSHNGRWLVSGSRDESVIVYDATRDFARHTTLMLNDEASAVCFSPDDSLLAIGADSGCSAIYSVDAFALLRALAGDHSVWCVAWLGNDAASLVGGTEEGDLVVWHSS